MGAFADFNTKKGEVILMQTAISLVSIDAGKIESYNGNESVQLEL